MTLDEAIPRLVDVLERLERRLAENDQTTVNVARAGELLGCQRRQVFKLKAEGKLRGVLVGRQLRITMESIHALQGLPGRRAT